MPGPPDLAGSQLLFPSACFNFFQPFVPRVSLYCPKKLELELVAVSQSPAWCFRGAQGMGWGAHPLLPDTDPLPARPHGLEALRDTGSLPQVSAPPNTVGPSGLSCVPASPTAST